jgi:hypothetical protein
LPFIADILAVAGVSTVAGIIAVTDFNAVAGIFALKSQKHAVFYNS